MLTNSDAIALGIFMFLCIILLSILNYLLKRKSNKQLHSVFIILLLLMLFWIICMILQIICINVIHADFKYVFLLAHIGPCFMPVVCLFIALIFSRTKINFNKKHGILFIIPIISTVLLWTNDFHHLFYKIYSPTFSSDNVGWYFYVYTYYTYILFGIADIILIKYSIKNLGFFSKQAILIFIGTLIPFIINVLGFINVISSFSSYFTPISLAFTVICFSFALFKFKFISTTPIALQKIVDRISDSYVILDEDSKITDFNETFLHTFHVKADHIRGKNIFQLLNQDIGNTFQETLDKIKNSTETFQFEQSIPNISKTFTVEMNNIYTKNNFLGILVLFKDITQHKQDIETIENNQEMLVEQERLASLRTNDWWNRSQLKNTYFLCCRWLRRSI